MLRERATSLETWKVQVIVDRVMPVAPDPIPITAHPTKSVIGRTESRLLSLRLARRPPRAQPTRPAQGTGIATQTVHEAQVVTPLATSLGPGPIKKRKG